MSERRTRLLSVMVVLFGITLGAACRRSAEAPHGQALPSIPFEKYSLANGLEVILSEDHRLPLVAVDIWYHVGPANEAAGRTGFAHLFEHMMFQGSKHVPADAHFRLLESAGASSVNGTTGFDRTNYFETLPANQLELGLWLESDRMGYLLDTVDELKLANQQDVVRNERRQSHENAPYGIVREALYQELYPKGHPYYANVIGSHQDIQAAKLDDVKQFFKQYYAPNNASLAIVGDFKTATVKPLVEKYFGPLARGRDVPPVTVTTPPITSEKRLVVQDRVQLAQVQMAWLTPAFFKPGDSEADAAAGILGGNNSSRLYKALVYEQQIAQDVQAFQASQALGSAFQIVATVRPGKTPEAVEQAITAELEKFRKEGPTEAEVERSRNTFETMMLQGLESLGGFNGIADTLNMFNHYVKDPGYLGKYIDEHRKLTPASVKAFAAQYLTPTSRVVIHAVPGEQKLAPPVATPPPPKVAPGTGAEAVNADEPWRADLPKPDGTINVALPTPASFTLSNGLTVIHHSRPGVWVESASLVFRTGGEANPPGRSGLANFLMTLLDQGTSSRNAAKIADDLAQIGASLTAASTKDSMSVSIGALARNFSAALDLLSDVSLRPTVPAEEVERQRQSRLANLAGARQNPNTVGQINAIAALFGPDHPYGYIELGDEAAAKVTTRDDIVNFWKAHFVPSNAALVVSGSLGEAQLRPLVEKAFGGWTGGQATEPTFGAPVTTPARVVISDRKGAPQTSLVVAAPGVERANPDYPALNVMDTILGGLFSSRIMLNLREAHGYTYGASSQFVYRKKPGIFWVRTGVRTDVTAPAVSEILKEVRRMGTEPVTADELALAKDSLVRALPADFETGASTVNSLSNLFIYQLGLDYYTRYPALIGTVDAAAVQQVAGKYLDAGKLIIVAVGDRALVEPALRKLNLGGIEIRDADGKIIK